jgi:hypothetical protein
MSGAKIKLMGLGGVAILAVAGVGTAGLAHAPLPPGHAGQCFAEAMRPPVYRTVTETVPGPPIVSYRVIPAVLGHGTRQVVAVPARIERQVVPATYKTEPRWSIIPGKTHWVQDAPVYRDVTETTMISPAHVEWHDTVVQGGFVPEQVQGGFGVAVRPTGVVRCRVLVPARYATVTRRVMVSPGGAHPVSGPSRKVMCYVRVIATPARTIEHRIPAQYRTVQTTYVIHPAHRERVTTPGPARQISRRVIATPAQKAWTPVHCTEVHHAIATAAPPAPQPQAQPQAQPHGRPYPPDAILAPTPSYPQARAPSRSYGNGPQHFTLPPLVPAPYDTGHPAAR